MKRAVAVLVLTLCMQAPGAVWILDDFESYDKSGNRIYDTWLDGLQNWTGSEVNDVDPCDEPAHEGMQSMMYKYSNNVNWGQGYYSEIERRYDSPMDWTAPNVKGLTLYFYGDPENDANATEQMYFGITDMAGKYAEVRYGDHGEDMNDIQIAGWTDWNIYLQDFNDGGVDLGYVSSILIGFGDRDNLLIKGGAGVVYFDDIQVYDRKCVPRFAPAADFTGDCRVNFHDLKKMAELWLGIHEEDRIDLEDYAVLTNMWLSERFFPPD